MSQFSHPEQINQALHILQNSPDKHRHGEGQRGADQAAARYFRRIYSTKKLHGKSLYRHVRKTQCAIDRPA
jgi:hypothetical protein